ncbi:MAG: hypothetical protein PHE87_06270 [Victivallaceae bacterium]|nr:hypothetical protein [Victivallaceae bacterium]
MNLLDWLIVLIPTVFVVGMGLFSRRYIRGVADFLSAGRICGRYVICIGDVANALSIIGLVAFVEVHYKTGFALTFWTNLLLPLGVIIGLTGYCTYRFRETKAMSLGQFLEMRYSRPFRIFASALRSVSEMLANMIMPAIAARFFIYFLDLPHHIIIYGVQLPTFMIIVTVVLILAISIICMGGTLALVITDSIQGMFLYPLLVVFTVFILYKFSWSNEIVPVMLDRAPGESFLNPYDISKLRDFNVFFLVVTIFATVLHRASWIGAGTSSAAKSPHEQKMAGLLGAWRGLLGMIFYVLIAITIITVLNHKNFATQAKSIRVNISNRVVGELVKNPAIKTELLENYKNIPIHTHTIGVDEPISEEKSMDTAYLTSTREILQQDEKGNAIFQQFRTLYHQMMLAETMRSILPTGLLGAFCLLLVLAMISTDDTRIFSAALTVAQDVVLPLKKKPFTPKGHIQMLRIISILVGVFFFVGSFFMAQLDYIQLFVTIMVSMWMGGCGPVMVFGLYSRFGTTAGAWTSLLTGMFLSIGSVLIQRNWADYVYPWMERVNIVEYVGNVLTKVSVPFNPYIVWTMNPVKCPINSYEFYFMTMVITLFLYIVVSWMTCRTPFNLDRMLHRGKYNINGEDAPQQVAWSFRTVVSKLIGITSEYSKGDRFIAWFFFVYSFIYKFIIIFLLVIIWNAFSPWPLEWWGHYFFIVTLIIPGVLAFITVFWFGIGGIKDLFCLFRDLEARVVNPLDDGRVDGHVSLVDKAVLDAIDQAKSDNSQDSNSE